MSHPACRVRVHFAGRRNNKPAPKIWVLKDHNFISNFKTIEIKHLWSSVQVKALTEGLG